MKTKSILVISFSHLGRDPRVNRQLRFLSSDYQLIAAGLGDSGLEGVDFVSLHQSRRTRREKVISGAQLLTGRYEAYYWQQPVVQEAWRKCAGVQADAILANDIETLPLALRLAHGRKVILDAHEYAPREYEEHTSLRLILLQRLKTALCRRYIPMVDGMLTVCEGIAREYEKDNGIRPLVITNAPFYEELQPRLLDENTKAVRLVHHGGANRARKLELMIDMMAQVDERFSLDVMLVPVNKGEIEYLRSYAASRKNIRFVTPVPMRDIAAALNHYDMGVYILHPGSYNNLHALPNKLFEFIQARLAVAIGPSPEMARIVNETGCGIVAEDFSPHAMAALLNSLDNEQINRYKLAAHRAAPLHCAEQNKNILLDYLASVLAG